MTQMFLLAQAIVQMSSAHSCQGRGRGVLQACPGRASGEQGKRCARLVSPGQSRLVRLKEGGQRPARTEPQLTGGQGCLTSLTCLHKGSALPRCAQFRGLQPPQAAGSAAHFPGLFRTLQCRGPDITWSVGSSPGCRLVCDSGISA